MKTKTNDTENGSILKPLLLAVALLTATASLTYAMVVTKASLVANQALPATNVMAAASVLMDEFTFRVGDTSQSKSEKWEMTIKGDNDAPNVVRKVTMTTFGDLTSKSFRLPRNQDYAITLKHLGSKQRVADCDWDAQVMWKKSRLSSSGWQPNADVLSAAAKQPQLVKTSAGGLWVLVNDKGLLGKAVSDHINTPDLTTNKTAWLKRVTLNITDGGGKSISSGNNNNTAIVGQKIQLVANTGGVTFSNFNWTVAGYAVGGYVVETGVLTTNFSKTASSVNFYWVDGGTKQVTCSAVCAGVRISTSVTIDVVKPTATLYTETSGTRINGGKLQFTIGAMDGITFYNSLSIPAGFSGSNVFSQIMTQKTITRTENSGAVHNWTNACPPPFGDLPAPYDQGLVGMTIFTPVDSPYVALQAGYKEVSLSYKFTMTMLFQPPGGIAVPLLSVDWYWKASATKASGGGWVVGSDDHSVNPPPAPTINFPQWNCASTNGGFN